MALQSWDEKLVKLRQAFIKKLLKLRPGRKPMLTMFYSYS